MMTSATRSGRVFRSVSPAIPLSSVREPTPYSEGHAGDDNLTEEGTGSVKQSRTEPPKKRLKLRLNSSNGTQRAALILRLGVEAAAVKKTAAKQEDVGASKPTTQPDSQCIVSVPRVSNGSSPKSILKGSGRSRLSPAKSPEKKVHFPDDSALAPLKLEKLSDAACDLRMRQVTLIPANSLKETLQLASSVDIVDVLMKLGRGEEVAHCLISSMFRKLPK